MKWVRSDSRGLSYGCSGCGGSAMRNEHDDDISLTPYCPWCGQKAENCVEESARLEEYRERLKVVNAIRHDGLLEAYRARMKRVG